MTKEKYFLFDQLLDAEGIKKIIDFIQDNEGALNIVISSDGGKFWLTSFLSKILNDNADRITLTAIENIYSSAFYLFLSFQGKKALTFGCMGMVHYGSKSITITHNGLPYYDDEKIWLLNCKEKADYCHDMISSVLTESEFNSFKNNGHVYLSFERLRQIFPEAEIVKY